MADTSSTGPRFRGTLTLEGVQTSDKRMIDPNGSTWRGLPMTMMAMTKASHGGAPTTETQPAGAIDLVERRPGKTDGSFELYYEGFYDTGEVGTESARLTAAGVVTGVSIDFAVIQSELEILAEDEEGWPTDWIEHYNSIEILGATVCPFPAFEGGTIELVEPLDAQGGDEPVDAEAATSDLLDLDARLPALVASACAPCQSERAGALVAAGGPLRPPADWFDDPQLDGPTAIEIGDDGRIYGHLALWNTCHVGQLGQCITPPRSATNYASFRLHSTLTAEGTKVATGTLVMGTPHADTHRRLSIGEVQAHYADTGQATADVATGEDRHGIWVAGAMRPDLTEAQMRAARGSVLSGDWRPSGTGHELAGVLHVNVPGFPVPRVSLVASGGEAVALTASGASAMAQLAAKQRKAQAHTSAEAMRDVIRQELAPLLEPLAERAREAARAQIAGSLAKAEAGQQAVADVRAALAAQRDRTAEALRAEARAMVGR
jgi:hypothetical protein